MIKQLAQQAYETFCSASGNRVLLSWEELPPIVQDAWKTTVKTIQLQIYPSDLLAAAKEVERWWIEEEMVNQSGAPAGIFMLREAIAQEVQP